MWALLLQTLAVVIGWLVVRMLPIHLRRLECLAASVAVGSAISGWIYFLAAWLVGWNIALPLATATLVAVGALMWWRLKPRLKLTSAPYGPSLTWRIAGVATGVMTAALVVYIVYLSYHNPAVDGSWWSDGNVWGDLPVHTSFITQFAHGNKLDLTSPLYKKIPLTYPLISDLWSGVLMRVTNSWNLGLLVPTAVMVLALVQLMFSFAWRLLGSARAAWMAWLMVIYSGSFHAGLQYGATLLTKGWAAYHVEVGTAFNSATGDNYMNLLYSHPFPQRAYLFGMPLLIVVLTVLIELYRRRTDTRVAGRRDRRVLALMAGGLAGIMPLVHVHSFLIVMGLAVLGVAGWWWQDRKWPREAMWFGLPAFGLAVPQVWWQFGSSYHTGFSYWIHGWVMKNFVADPHTNWLWFWFMQLGWLFVALLLGWWWLRRQRAKAEVWWLYSGGVLIFAICNVYVFQPTEWDNMKFFEYAFWFVMLAAAGFMSSWLRPWWGKVVVGLLLVSVTMTGVMNLALSAPRLSFQLLTPEDVAFGNHMRLALPVNAYILSTDRHNNPLLMFADRKMLMSFAGWYVNYGSDWPQTYNDRTEMLAGASGAADLINQYGVNFAAFTDADIYSGSVNQTFFSEHYTLFVHEANWWVYRLR